MTSSGVRPGSGGEGVRPGAGGSGVVVGGGGDLTVNLIGSANTSGLPASLVTSSFTPTDGPDTYLAFWGLARGSGSVDPGTPTLTGMGLTWALLNDHYYDPSGLSRQRMGLFRAYGTGASGALTLSWSAGAGAVIHVVSVAADLTAVRHENGAGVANPAVLAVTTPSAGNLLFLQGSEETFSGTTTLDAGYTEIAQARETNQGTQVTVASLEAVGTETTTSSTMSGAGNTWGLSHHEFSA